MKKVSFFNLTIFLLLLINSISGTSQNIPDFLVNEQGSIDGAQQATPSISGDGNGNYVLTWKDKRNGSDFDIFAQIYLSDGTPSGGNFKVNDDVINALQYRPIVAVNANLDFVIAWIDRRNGDPNTDWDVYAQRFSSDGNPLGDNFIVNDEGETDEKDHPSISIDSIGNFVIIWSDRRGSPWDIYGQRFLNDGTAEGNNFKINDDIGNYFQHWPTSACDKNGTLVVSWVDKRNNTDRQIYAQRYAADGTTLGNNFKVNTDITGTNHIRPDIAIDGNSNFIIAWEDNRNGWVDIYAQRYLNDGSTIGDNFKVNDDTPNSSQNNPSIVSDFAGNFTVCWEDSRNDYNDIYARRYSSDGSPLSDDFKVNTDFTNAKQENSVIEADEDGNFIICWEDHRYGYNGEIFAQTYLDDGTPVDENFIINDDDGSENQQCPSIAVDGNENFTIVWADSRFVGNGIYGQRFTSDGTALADNFKINDDEGDNWGLDPSVATNFDGSFVVTWADLRSQSCFEIYAQRFSGDGIPLGSNFKVNYLSACINYCPVVVCKQNGDFIIIWGDMDEGGKMDHFPSQDLENKLPSEKLMGEPDIWAQQYLSDGTPIGENFKVNDDGGFESQMNPDIAVDGDGNFVVVWEDHRNDIYEIYLQRYLSEGAPLGSNSKVEDIIYCDWALAPSVSMDQTGNFNVSWRDNRNDYFDIFCKRFSSNGIAIGNSFQVNSESGIDYRHSPSISTNTGGNFTIAWTNVDEGNHDVYAQQYLNDGTAYGNNYRISIADEMEQSAPEVVLGNSRIFYTWHDNSDGNTGFDIWTNVVDWDNIVGVGNTFASELYPKPYLFQNFPNPFSSSTTIKFDLPEPAKVKLEVFNHFGQKIETLVQKPMDSGSFEVEFLTRNLPDGVYLLRLVANSQGKSAELYQTKMMIMR